MKIKITEVRKAHDQYAMTEARFGENNLATIRALMRYQELRSAYEAESGKAYSR